MDLEDADVVVVPTAQFATTVGKIADQVIHDAHKLGLYAEQTVDIREYAVLKPETWGHQPPFFGLSTIPLLAYFEWNRLKDSAPHRGSTRDLEEQNQRLRAKVTCTQQALAELAATAGVPSNLVSPEGIRRWRTLNEATRAESSQQPRASLTSPEQAPQRK